MVDQIQIDDNHVNGTEDTGKNTMSDKIDQLTTEDLLNWDGNLNRTKEIIIPSFGKKITVRSLNQNEIQYCQEKAVKYVGRGPNRMREIDDMKQLRLTVFTGVTNPDFSDHRLQEKFNAGRANYLIVEKFFLPGEMLLIANTIGRLSGYSENIFDDQEEEDNAINLS